MSASVVLYRYDSSPHSSKIRDSLLLKKIPQRWVTVAPILPRPELTDLLGLGHRRIPVLAIGRDIYLDTALIASTLERRFAAGAGPGYGTLFPPRKDGGRVDKTLIKLFVKYWSDAALFRAAVALLPWKQVPAAFLKDREALLGGPIPVDKLAAARPASLAKAAAQIALLEEQLADGREWLFDTVAPSYADVAANFGCVWTRNLSGDEALVPDKFPGVVAWMGRFAAYCEQLKEEMPVPSARLTGEEAAKEIAAGAVEPESIVGFDELEAGPLGLKLGQTVSVTAEGPGNIPTSGNLVALSREEIVIEVTGQAGAFRCHFPRVDYLVVPAAAKL
ncbi:Glutathione s-transferase [Mycena kentingensis (nom. inval.)]|nr:Glutathione s-transferase [Mycena kentingensis (nom. inval.)]